MGTDTIDDPHTGCRSRRQIMAGDDAFLPVEGDIRTVASRRSEANIEEGLIRQIGARNTRGERPTRLDIHTVEPQIRHREIGIQTYDKYPATARTHVKRIPVLWIDRQNRNMHGGQTRVQRNPVRAAIGTRKNTAIGPGVKCAGISRAHREILEPASSKGTRCAPAPTTVRAFEYLGIKVVLTRRRRVDI